MMRLPAGLAGCVATSEIAVSNINMTDRATPTCHQPLAVTVRSCDGVRLRGWRPSQRSGEARGHLIRIPPANLFKHNIHMKAAAAAGRNSQRIFITDGSNKCKFAMEAVAV